MEVIERLKDLAYSACQFTSFSPDKRGEHLIKEYSEDLRRLLEEIPEEDRQWITEKYVSLLSSWWYAKSRCMSSMITGPSNFPVKRAQKLNNWEEGHYRTFADWRKTIAAKLKRKAARQNWTIEGEIHRLKNELEILSVNQSTMKAVNKILLAKMPQDEKVEELQNIGFHNLTIEDFPNVKGFEAFRLTNNRNKIKGREARIEELEKRLKAQEHEPKETTTNGIRIVENVAENRLQLFFEGVPAPAIRAILKKNGYRWAPSANCWQSFLSGKWKLDNVLNEISSL